VGREREIASVARALGAARLLTLTGTGGAGKTRLSIEVASRSLKIYPGGVCFVELAPLQDPALVAPAVASALGLREQSDRPLLSSITARLASDKSLLLLDNCEHLIRASATLADTLLRDCPDLTVLATSRQPLNIVDETVWRTPALSFPDPHHLPPLETLRQYESVQLFIERVRAKRARFSLTPANAHLVARLCYHLDGLPLAIELAAARASQLSVEEIVERLDERLRFLASGVRGALPRHQTLRAAIDWSYDLLSDPARTLLRRLGVFAGSFTLEAVTGICAEVDEHSARLLDTLTELADLSLVVAEDTRGETRYRLLDTIRQYAEERAREEEDLDSLRKRHLAWYGALAETARPELQGQRQTEWLARLEAEHDNLRAALGYAEGGGDGPEAGPKLARALSWFWYVHGHSTEGRRWLESALEKSEGLPELLRAELLYGAGLLARAQGDLEHAADLFTQALALYRDLGDAHYVSATLNHLGVVYINSGDYARATEVLEEAIAIRQDMGDSRGVAISLNNLANIASDRGDYALARHYYAECVEIHRSVQNAVMLSVALNNLGNTLRYLGEYDEAQRLVEESLAIKRDLADRVEIASSLHKLAEIEWCRRNYDKARGLCEEGLAALEGTGDKEATGLLYNALGEIARTEGKYPEARSWYERTLATTKEKWVTTDSTYNLGHLAQQEKRYAEAGDYLRASLGDYAQSGGKRGIAECLLAVAKIAAATGLTGQAATLFGAADALLEATGYRLHPEDRDDRERVEATARTSLGKGVWADAWSEGHALSPEEAVQVGVSALEAVSLVTAPKKRRSRRVKYPNNLTRREVDVLQLVADGLTDIQIAERLALSANTVHAHLHSIYSKLNVTTRAAAGRFAVDNGLV
jgi:non-specific serine/threonine protein kinase